LIGLWLGLGALAWAACSPTFARPVSGEDERALEAPARAGYEPVADALILTCGTLDCHGQRGRNLRLFGNHGVRLAAKDDPGGAPTSPAEYDADYWSLIGLEPETLDLVMRTPGADPELLSLFRKPRGTEEHKGGTLMRRNDPLDRCLRSWLAGALDEDACVAAGPQRPDAGD
jgi:hypothetical protein